ncbi:trypsin-like [Bacillus rossius redtenbacheri]|uniref:trypsin-like n=1 Tax=Bacillus rossius redtenbacheri TaxID=93214 RepID=UPI002FDEA8A2
MNIFLLFLLFSWVLLSFIVRGNNGAVQHEIQLEEYPYLVSLHLVNFGHLCTATIISKKLVLTAAHCLYDFKKKEFLDPADLRLVYGAQEMDSSLDYIYQPETEVRFVVSTYIHPRFDVDNFFQDIAMVNVDAPWDERAKLVTLPSFHVSRSALPEGYVCHVVGWWSAGKCGGVKTVLPSLISGEQHPQLDLQRQEQFLTAKMAQKVILDAVNCTNLSESSRLVHEYITICTYKEDKSSCDGDAGAPLICDNLQVGILSWGLGYKENGKAMPLVYARVNDYLPWIKFAIDVFESEAVMAGPHVVLLALPMLLAVLEVTL